MSGTDAPRAVLDTDIVFSRVMHELMGRVAKGLELPDHVWSEELLAEARRSLVGHARRSSRLPEVTEIG